MKNILILEMGGKSISGLSNRLLLIVAVLLCSACVYAQDGAKYEAFMIKKKTYNLGVSGAIDLGLNVKWAACNVGAMSPEEYGDYYAWGETEPKECYDWQSYFDSIYATGPGFRGKYKSGLGNSKTKLEPEDDVARKRMGEGWCIPSRNDVEELYPKCKWKQTKYKGRKGYLVIGGNGNAIFLPFAGIFNQYRLYEEDFESAFWINEIYSIHASFAYAFKIGYAGGRTTYHRCRGISVRGVYR